MKDRRKKQKSNRLLDFLVVLLCLFGATVFLYLFQQDLFNTVRSMSVEPVGAIEIKYNTVQRRLADRVIWDRLFVNSPVYPGDTIRIARLSGATLDINKNQIELGENTLIRIQKDTGNLEIDFFLGEISVTSGRDSGNLVMAVAGRQIETAPGTVFSASVSDKGMILTVNEGTAQIMDRNGLVETAAAGSVIAEDARGRAVLDPMLVVTHPKQNARFLKNVSMPFSLNFEWTRINLAGSAPLRLEIAHDRNFSRISNRIDNLDSSTAVVLEPGSWFWRFLYQNTELSSGRVTVTEAVKPELLSPQNGSDITFRASVPEAAFRWTAVPDVLNYILMVSNTPDFLFPRILTSVEGVSFVSRALDIGTWYWQVQPVYSAAYEGRSVYSDIGTFVIRQRVDLETVTLNTPYRDSAVYIGADRADTVFSWSASRDASSYTILISENANLSNPVISSTLRNNFYLYDKDDDALKTGQYYWAVSFTDEEGNSSPVSPARMFRTLDREATARLMSPPDRFSVYDRNLQEADFSWRTNLTHNLYLQVSSQQSFESLQINQNVTGDSVRGITLPEGDWYWRIQGSFDEAAPLVTSLARQITVLETPRPLDITLISPVQGITIPGRTARNQPVIFRWDTPDPVASSRFVLSRNANPAVGSPQIEINNPGRTVTVNTLGEGVWYWTIIAQTPDGRTFTAAEPRQITVQPIPPLRLTLISPEQGTVMPGRTALTTPTVFRWSTTENIASSRFVLSRNANPAVGRPEIEINNPGRAITVNSLEEGVWYWTVIAQSQDGLPVTALQPMRLTVQSVPALHLDLISPEQGHTISGRTARNQPVIFRWDTTENIASSVFYLSRNANPSAGSPGIEINTGERTVTVDSLDSGVWYWTVTARTQDGMPVTAVQPRQVVVEPMPDLSLTLISPSEGERIEGLKALLEPVTFVWDTTETIASSRFILSQDSSFEDIKLEIENIGRTFTVDSLEEGGWYWTIIAMSHDGIPAAPSSPGYFTVQPVPLLPPAENLQPADNHRVTAEHLRQHRNINFSWQEVEGANSYILTITRHTFTRRQEIFKSGLLDAASFSFESIGLLDYQGTYLIHVEAVFQDSNGRVIQRGQITENTLILDIPRPGVIIKEDTGILYGF